MFTLARLEATLDDLVATTGTGRPARLCVALSGGLDSTVLLDATAALARAAPERWHVRAVHVDHGLQADSPRWSEASRDLCAERGVPYEPVRVDARPDAGASPEAAARDARYAALRARLAPGELLLTAHHADDQLETVLLQWLRGGGLRAIAGMPALAATGAGAWHARPLLDCTRAELEQWARGRGLAWVDDPSNRELRHDRNYLRHAVLPALRQRWPGAARTAGRVAGLARDALALEAATAAEDLAALSHGGALELAGLWRLPPARQRTVVRAWLAAWDLPLPSADQLASLLRDARLAAEDRVPRTSWPGAVVHRYRGHLHAETVASASWPEGAWPDAATTRYDLGPDATLELRPDLGRGLSRERMPARLHVARRTGGEEFRPVAVTHRRPLRKWLQEQGVLPWRREHLPLLYDDAGRLVAVADLGCAHEYAARPGEPSWCVAWHGRGLVTEQDAFGFKWPVHPPIG